MQRQCSTRFLQQPTFNGKVANWQYYKVKMELYLAHLDLSELLDPSTMVEKDAHGGEKDDAKKKAIELVQKKNCKAAGILLNSVDTKTDKGILHDPNLP